MLVFRGRISKISTKFIWIAAFFWPLSAGALPQELMEEFREDWEPAVEALNEAEARLMAGRVEVELHCWDGSYHLRTLSCEYL